MSTVCILNFDHGYEEQDFYKEYKYQYIDLTDLTGVNGYCEKQSMQEIKKRIVPSSNRHITFLGSGNYHYVAYQYLSLIKEPFALLHFDHHTDAQKPLFGDLMSCGSWVERSVLDFPNLKSVVSIGVKKQYIETVNDEYRKMIHFISEEEIDSITWKQVSNLLSCDRVYISIDKDVLTMKDAVTNWDQGSLSKEVLFALIRECIKSKEVIGIDLCGEYIENMGRRQELKSHALCINNRINGEFLKLCVEQGILQRNKN